MEQHIRLLDCTLRDGGHIVQGQFGERVIKNTIEKLISAGVDIIEVGFLWDAVCGTDTARYYSISDAKKILPKDKENSKFSLMADFIDLEHLEPYDGTIDYIRLSFKRWRLDWALKTARILMDKGYRVFINPVNNNVYSDEEYIHVLQQVNKLHPYGFSIVDTFGVMRLRDFSHRYYLVENNLLPDITIGAHLHENLGLAYSLAQHFTEIASPRRNIVIDGSLLGMGRVPGNLCIEQIMDFMNDQFGTQYATEPVYDAIDQYIEPIKEQHSWGYAIPYALSAKYYLHRTYAEYLMEKQRLKTKDIQRILSQVDPKEAETFNETYIEQLYYEYMNVEYIDDADKEKLKSELLKFDKIFVLAPGQSLSSSIDKISEFIECNVCIISVNFIPTKLGISSDYIFLTNTKRYDDIKNNRSDEKLIISSNLMRDINNQDFTVAYNDLVYFKDVYCDDSTLMLLNLLNTLGVKEVTFAGFDGKIDGKLLFFDEALDRHTTGIKRKNDVKKILDTTFSHIKKTFLTDSQYM
ncbi:MAG: aldolase catalytic domain-containing protein [Clostridiales bacterium]|nr:aldolase catalytic domain-containing protein [Clostridiales bacterium]